MRRIVMAAVVGCIWLTITICDSPARAQPNSVDDGLRGRDVALIHPSTSSSSPEGLDASSEPGSFQIDHQLRATNLLFEFVYGRTGGEVTTRWTDDEGVSHVVHGKKSAESSIGLGLHLRHRFTTLGLGRSGFIAMRARISVEALEIDSFNRGVIAALTGPEIGLINPGSKGLSLMSPFALAQLGLVTELTDASSGLKETRFVYVLGFGFELLTHPRLTLSYTRSKYEEERGSRIVPSWKEEETNVQHSVRVGLSLAL